MANDPFDFDLADKELGELSGLNDFYKRNVEGFTKSAKAKGGVGTNKDDEEARKYARKQTKVEGEIFDRLFEQHNSRSEYAQKQDEARKARIPDSPETWANDPNSYDWPGIDTPFD